MEPYLNGWLYKLPTDGDAVHPFFKFILGRWRRRYFVLFGPPTSNVLPDRPNAVLEYYEDQEMKRKKGSIDLSTCDQVNTDHEFGSFRHVFTFEIQQKNKRRKVFHFAAGDKHSMEGWVDAINSLLGLSRGFSDHTTHRSSASVSCISDMVSRSRLEDLRSSLNIAHVEFVDSTLPKHCNECNQRIDRTCGKHFRHSIEPKMVACTPSPPPLKPRVKRSEVISELDVEVPLFYHKHDSQRDSGSVCGLLESPRNQYNCYKAPRHKYNDDVIEHFSQDRRSPFQVPGYAVPAKFAENQLRGSINLRSAQTSETAKPSKSHASGRPDAKNTGSVQHENITWQRKKCSVIYDVPKHNRCNETQRQELSEGIDKAEHTFVKMHRSPAVGPATTSNDRVGRRYENTGLGNNSNCKHNSKNKNKETRYLHEPSDDLKLKSRQKTFKESQSYILTFQQLLRQQNNKSATTTTHFVSMGKSSADKMFRLEEKSHWSMTEVKGHPSEMSIKKNTYVSVRNTF